jgi:adenylate cyclase
LMHFSLGAIDLIRQDPRAALSEMELEPTPVFRLQGRALAYYSLGRKKEAMAALAELIEKYSTEGAFQIAEVRAFWGEADPAFAWLERAYAQRDTGLPNIKGDPLMKNIESDPRYKPFLEKMRVPAPADDSIRKQ